MAAVPRPDDVGVDGLGSLLQLHDGMLYAEDQFYLQVKSAGTMAFPYLDWTPGGKKKEVREYTWLRGQRLPFFLASIDMKSSIVKVYSMHFARFSVNRHVATGVVAYIGDAKPKHYAPEGWPLEDDGKTPEPTPDTWPVVSLRHPIMEFTFAEVEEDWFPERSYRVLKAWCELETRYLAVDHASNVNPTGFTWKTNEPPVLTGGMMAVMNADDTLRVDLGDCAAILSAHLMKDLLQAQVSTQSSDSPESLRVRVVIDYFQSHGVPIVPLVSKARMSDGPATAVAQRGTDLPAEPSEE